MYNNIGTGSNFFRKNSKKYRSIFYKSTFNVFIECFSISLYLDGKPVYWVYLSIKLNLYSNIYSLWWYAVYIFASFQAVITIDTRPASITFFFSYSRLKNLPQQLSISFILVANVIQINVISSI